MKALLEPEADQKLTVLSARMMSSTTLGSGTNASNPGGRPFGSAA